MQQTAYNKLEVYFVEKNFEQSKVRSGIWKNRKNKGNTAQVEGAACGRARHQPLAPCGMDRGSRRLPAVGDKGVTAASESVVRWGQGVFRVRSSAAADLVSDSLLFISGGLGMASHNHTNSRSVHSRESKCPGLIMSYHSGFQMAFCLALLCITVGSVKSGSRRKKRKAEIHPPKKKIYIYIYK